MPKDFRLVVPTHRHQNLFRVLKHHADGHFFLEAVNDRSFLLDSSHLCALLLTFQ